MYKLVKFSTSLICISIGHGSMRDAACSAAVTTHKVRKNPHSFFINIRASAFFNYPLISKKISDKKSENILKNYFL